MLSPVCLFVGVGTGYTAPGTVSECPVLGPQCDPCGPCGPSLQHLLLVFDNNKPID